MSSAILKEIEEKAGQLPAAERELLAHKLFESVHNQEINEIDMAWLVVAEERVKAYRSGADNGIKEEEFFTQVKENLGWK